MHPFPFGPSYNEKKCSWLGPAYSWNKQLAHTPFPKKINTPSTTLRFIRFVAKISVLNPKLPADGQWPKETKESITFFICSPLLWIGLTKNRVLFVSLHSPFFDRFLFINFISTLFNGNRLNHLFEIYYFLSFQEVSNKILYLGLRSHINW